MWYLNISDRSMMMMNIERQTPWCFKIICGFSFWSTIQNASIRRLDHCLSPDLSKTGGLGGDNMTAVPLKNAAVCHVSLANPKRLLEMVMHFVGSSDLIWCPFCLMFYFDVSVSCPRWCQDYDADTRYWCSSCPLRWPPSAHIKA